MAGKSTFFYIHGVILFCGQKTRHMDKPARSGKHSLLNNQETKTLGGT